MEAVWNKMELEHPPNNIWQASADEIDVNSFTLCIDNAINDLESQNILHMEAAILSRLIYRMKSKFRNDKGLKNMEKVNRALLNYLNLKLHKEYKSLKDCIEPDGGLFNLPTRQMLEYVLVRTQGFGKLMCRVEAVAKCAAEFLKARINIGHAWTISVIAYAVISRIWVLSRYLVKRSCSWYNNIYQYLGKFRQIGVAWLPENYNLPKDLKIWLDVPWIDEEIKRIPTEDDGKETIFSLIGLENDDSEDLKFDVEEIEDTNKPTQLIDITETKNKQEEELAKEKIELQTEKKEVCYSMDDVGRSIDRDVFESELGTDVFGTQAPVVSEVACKKLKARKLNSLNKTEATPSKKKRKTLIKLDESDSEMTTLKADAVKKSPKTKSSKAKSLQLKDHVSVSPSKLMKQKQITPKDIKSKDDLVKFLSAESYPGLDRLQWKMLANSVKKFVTKLNSCDSSNTRRQTVLLKKAHRQIRNWII